VQQLLTSTILLLRDGGIWVISEKNILQTDFKGKKCYKENRKYLWKTYILSALNKKILWRIMLREKSSSIIYRGTKCNISPEVWGRGNSYPN